MKTSFEKFMASSAVNQVELSAMSVELGVIQDAQKAMLLYLAGMYNRLPIEDKLLFDKWVREHQEFLERK